MAWAPFTKLCVIGRPITTKLAPRSIASRGVIVRAWSSPPAESAGLTPGVIMMMSSPRFSRMAKISSGEQTIALAPPATATFAKPTAVA